MNYSELESLLGIESIEEVTSFDEAEWNRIKDILDKSHKIILKYAEIIKPVLIQTGGASTTHWLDRFMPNLRDVLKQSKINPNRGIRFRERTKK